MRQVLALAERLLGHAVRLIDGFLRELVPEAMLVDCNQAEAARRERIAKHGIHAGTDPWWPAGHLAQDEITGLRVLEVADEQLAAFALVDRRKPETLAFLLHHAEHQLRRSCELLQRWATQPCPFPSG